MNSSRNDSGIDAGFDRNRRDALIGGALAAVGLGLSGKVPADSPLKARQPYGPTSREAMP
jgi:hypothetical protein